MIAVPDIDAITLGAPCGASVIAPKPASSDRLKTGHFRQRGDKVHYFESESLGKFVA